MAGRNWTPEQLAAINQRGCNLLVAAAAGAGKTSVLVERIIRKITEPERPVDLDRLLVVTFTNAAATEMRERIGIALANALEADPSRADLQRQMITLDRASIMTLHSFCLETIRRYFHTLDLDPSFRVADETESVLIKMDALEELFEEKYENESEDSVFFSLVDSYGGGYGDDSLREIIMNVHRFTRSCPWPEQWLAGRAEIFGTDVSTCLGGTPWARVLLDYAAAELQGLKALLERAAASAYRGVGLEPYCGVLEDDLKQLDSLLETTLSAVSAKAYGWDDVCGAFAAFKPARLPRCGKNVDKDLQEDVKAARNQMKEGIKRLKKSGFDTEAAVLAGEFKKIYPLMKYISDMVNEFDYKYMQKKKAKDLLDFNDLEHYCLKVLIRDGQATEAAKELRERYEEILIDEYQDSNLIQELIINTVSGNQDGRYNIFMVGDVKQSIYRFRQAMPELFMSKYKTYPRSDGYDSRVIQLYKNFRSRPEIINGVNFIFGQIMSSLVGELEYTADEALNQGAEFDETEVPGRTGGPVEVHIIDVAGGTAEAGRKPGESGAANDEEAGWEEYTGEGRIEEQDGRDEEEADNIGNGTEDEPLDNIQVEARIVGKRIQDIVSRSEKGLEIYDKKIAGYRPAKYKDIVILMRATRNRADTFAEELSDMGIPVYADTGLGYFRTIEVETMLALLQIIDNPLQDIPMLAVLRSPIAGFSTDELADVRLADRLVSIYEAMKLIGGSHIVSDESGISDHESDGPDSKGAGSAEGESTGTGSKSRIGAEPDLFAEKIHKFLSQLEKWRKSSLYMSTDEMVLMLLNETGYYSYAGILPKGAERQANLRMLFERARQFEETSYKGLFNFINFVNKLRSGGGDMGSARILGENDDVVRIMSIHKSKGLEFPIVILAGCGKRFNMTDLNATILMHHELGYGPDLVDPVKRTVMPLATKHAIRQKLRLETLSEEMRILYVAFTRAREKLILVGCIRDAEKVFRKWCNISECKGAKLPLYDMQRAATCFDWLGPAIARHEAGEIIRNTAGRDDSEGTILSDRSDWEVKLWYAGDAKTGKADMAGPDRVRKWLGIDELSIAGESLGIDEQNIAGEKGSTYEKGDLIKKLEWKYPYSLLSAVPAKISVTEIKRRFSGDESEGSSTPFTAQMTARPRFMEAEKGLDRAAIGTVMHFVMQNVDLQKLAGVLDAYGEDVAIGGDKSGVRPGDALRRELRMQVKTMTERNQLTETEADTVNIEAIAVFFETPVGKEVLYSQNVRRETAFNVEINCTDIFSELPEEFYSGEKMLLQGIIDCWYESEEGLILIDYKTDYVPTGGVELIKKRYAVQLDYYSRALEKITGKKVWKKYLYLFHIKQLAEYTHPRMHNNR